jgi:SAM-dependent methyltransferase
MIIFDSRPNPERHPDRLRVISKLRGLQVAPVSKARILDLGCGTGLDIIAWALQYPEAEFLGIDNDKNFINLGNKLISDLSLKNIKLQEADILDYKVEDNTWDYIISHGVYSWVPDSVQTAILNIITSGLKPTGVASLSYNVLPGWETRRVTQKIIQTFDNQNESPEWRVDNALKSLNRAKLFLNDSASLHSQQIVKEIDSVLRQSGAFIYHELLNLSSVAFYYTEFNDQITKYRLQILGDGDPRKFNITPYDSVTSQQWQEFEQKDFIKINQFMDLLNNTSLRSAVLCKDSVVLSEQPEYSSIFEMFVSSGVRKENEVGEDTNQMAIYAGPAGSTIEINDSRIKYLLNLLSDNWPKSKAVTEIMTNSSITSNSTKTIYETIGELFLQGIVNISLEPAKLLDKINELPKVYSLAKEQAKLGFAWVTNLHFEFVPISEFDRELIILLDGKLNLLEVTKKLISLIETGQIQVKLADGYSSDDLESLLLEQVKKSIDQYYQMALIE